MRMDGGLKMNYETMWTQMENHINNRIQDLNIGTHTAFEMQKLRAYEEVRSIMINVKKSNEVLDAKM